MTVEMYGAEWCGDCVRAKMILDRNGVEYVWHDTDASEEYQAKALEISGLPKIPVIVIPDGTYLSEPSNPQIEEKLEANGMI